MCNLKKKLISQVIEREGGYSNDPSDRGGETMYGITEQVARENGYNGNMKYLPYALAFSIYQKRYWDTLKLDAISTISQEVAKQLFDFGVNSGISNAGRTFQTVLNVLNQQQALYPDLVADGILGSKTLRALTAYLKYRHEAGLAVLSEVIRGKRISFCVDIAMRDQTQERYQYGWLKRIVHL
jgi:lysozyme family protein